MCPRTAQLGIPLRPPGPQTMGLPPGGPQGPYIQPSSALQCFPQRPLFQHFHPQAGWTLMGHPPTSNQSILKPQVTSWVLQDGPISSNTCDIEDIKYGPFSDGEAEKCHQHYNRLVLAMTSTNSNGCLKLTKLRDRSQTM